jgi:flagellar motor switch protein FliN/FliY
MSDARPNHGPLFEAIAREVAGAVVALVGETTQLVAQTTVPQPVWTTALRASGARTGTIRVGLTEEDGRRISGLVLGLDEATPAADDAVLDTLREIGRQAIGALTQAPEAAGVVLAVEDVWRAAPESTGTRAWRFTLPGGTDVSIVLGGELADSVDAAPSEDHAADAAPAPGGVHLDLLLDLDLPLSVRFGQTQLTVQSLTRLAPGSVIDLHRSLEEPVEVLVSGRVVARGEVVVVDGNYGVRVTEVVSTADRIRSLGA